MEVKKRKSTESLDDMIAELVPLKQRYKSMKGKFDDIQNSNLSCDEKEQKNSELLQEMLYLHERFGVIKSRLKDETIEQQDKCFGIDCDEVKDNQDPLALCTCEVGRPPSPTSAPPPLELTGCEKNDDTYYNTDTDHKHDGDLERSTSPAHNYEGGGDDYHNRQQTKDIDERPQRFFPDKVNNINVDLNEVKRDIQKSYLPIRAFCEHSQILHGFSQKDRYGEIQRCEFNLQGGVQGDNYRIINNVPDVHNPNNIDGFYPYINNDTTIAKSMTGRLPLMNFYFTKVMEGDPKMIPNQIRRFVYDEFEINRAIFESKDISVESKSYCARSLCIPESLAEKFGEYASQLLALYEWQFGHLRKTEEDFDAIGLHHLESYATFNCLCNREVFAKYSLMPDRALINPVIEMIESVVPDRVVFNRQQVVSLIDRMIQYESHAIKYCDAKPCVSERMSERSFMPEVKVWQVKNADKRNIMRVCLNCWPRFYSDLQKLLTNLAYLLLKNKFSKIKKIY